MATVYLATDTELSRPAGIVDGLSRWQLLVGAKYAF
jgi:hypothetical protein